MTKIIVECEKCKHQYKVFDKRVGEKFSCFCGSLLTVPSVKIHDAAVVRCSSCGGARGDSQKPNCGYCGSSFTLHERDLNTICPHCMTRISSKAKFCHSCATPIVADIEDFTQTSLECPSCNNSKLHSRAMQGQSFNLKECSHCAGIWMGTDVFMHLEKKAQSEAASGVFSSPEKIKIHAVKEQNLDPTKYYRNCPNCNVLMNRKNYANNSGIVVDVCTKHGMWFDIHELDEILEFIRSGKLLKQQQKSARKAKQEIRKAKTVPYQEARSKTKVHETSSSLDVFSEIIDWLLD